MSHTGIAVLDGATQQANTWLNDLHQTAHLDSKKQACRLLRATLHTRRDWVNADQAADLGAQLPVLLRGIYCEGWNPSAKAKHPRNKDAFVANVQSEFKADPLRNPDLAIGAVFVLLDRHVGSGQLTQMRKALQKPLRELWPETF